MTKKTLLVLALGLILCGTSAVRADELKVNVGIESGTSATKVVGADIYATIDGNLTKISVSPEDTAFKMSGKFGALRISSWWMTQAKVKEILGSQVK